jgi:hypothetical protein
LADWLDDRLYDWMIGLQIVWWMKGWLADHLAE